MTSEHGRGNCWPKSVLSTLFVPSTVHVHPCPPSTARGPQMSVLPPLGLSVTKVRGTETMYVWAMLFSL